MGVGEAPLLTCGLRTRCGGGASDEFGGSTGKAEPFRKSDGEAVKRDMTTKPRETVDLSFFGEEIVDQV